MVNYDIYTDAGKFGDLAVVLYKNDSELFRDSIKRDVQKSHNEYEYHAVIYALQEIFPQQIEILHSHDTLTIHSDSQLVINQVNGIYKCESDKLKRCKLTVENHVKEFEAKNSGLVITFKWVPRERNPAGWILEMKKQFRVRSDLLDHKVSYQDIKARIEKLRKEGKLSFTVKELLKES